jgi:hypothetical protein
MTFYCIHNCQVADSWEKGPKAHVAAFVAEENGSPLY